MAKRRTLRGSPLLVAGTTVAMVIGCGGPKTVDYPLGNLMPPPEVTGEVCVDVVPNNAEVVINGTPKGEDRCQTVTSHSNRVQIFATALGYETSSTAHEFVPGGSVDVAIALVETAAPPPPPVGNLMPPLEIPPPIELPEK